MKQLEQLTAWCYGARRRFAATGVGLLVCLAGYHVVFGANGMVVYAHKRSEFRRSQQELEALARENDRLRRRIQALKSDPATIEKEAREQLRYTRPGEAVYVLPEPPQKPAPPVAAQNR